MTASITKHYFEKRIADDAAASKRFLNKRAFNTIDRLLRHTAHRNLAGRVLDVGCGDGAFVAYCNEQGLAAQGVDIADGVDFETDALAYPDHSFDIVTMLSVIEHIKDPSNLLKEIQRVLSKDGLLVVITPNLYTTRFHFWDDPTHARPYSPISLPWLMSIFHFEKVALVLWTVGKSLLFWSLPERLQFFIGAHLPFAGLNKYAPGFLKGRSTTMLAVFRRKG